MLKCPKCGTELEYGMKECDFCFRPLTPRELTELERQHFEADYSAKFAGQIQRKKNTKKWLIIVACIIALIILAAVICQAVFQKSIITVIKESATSLYHSVFKSSEEETEEEKFLRLKDFADQMCEQYKDSEFSKSMYKDFDQYLLFVLETNVETVYPGEFTDSEITLKTQNRRITQFSWNGWTYINHNGYSRVLAPGE